MKPVVSYPDVERVLVDELAALADVVGATVGVGVPTGWTPDTSPPHLQVAWDGTPAMTHPVAAFATVRVVARAESTSDAKRLADTAMGFILSLTGVEGLGGITVLTGILPARDPDTRAELASFTVRVALRASLVPLDGS